MFFLNFFWIVFSYILGSIPFGYLIGRSCGKNVLRIGWRKTSGSNVFKNVGKWQGALTGILDISKGALAVLGARQLGLAGEIQVLSGVAAVTGHNWSLFLKFAGGRGIGTFIGAFAVFSPKILAISLIPLLLLGLIWTASIGTILFLALAVVLAVYFDQFETVGFFVVLSLFPIFIKRLSPIKEIFLADKKIPLLFNRLIFDDDKPYLELRIKKLFKKVRDNPGKISKITKPFIAPVLMGPRVSWAVAKFGVKIVQRPIEPARELFSRGVQKIISQEPEKVITEIRTEDLEKMMIASAKKIVLHQEEINRINVFPVADKDTGYNLAATLLGIESALGQKEHESIADLVKSIKEGAMNNARGNVGMIFSGYLMRVLDQIKGLKLVDAKALSLAMRKGIKAAYLSIEDPVEGTILDVIKAAGEKANEMVKTKKEENIIKILEESYQFSLAALEETKEKLEVLKKNDVVDAGALGFVKILEAWIESLKGLTPTLRTAATQISIGEPIPAITADLKYRYCFQLVFAKNGEELFSFRERLSSYGGSIEVLESEDKIRVHIHTNKPETIKEKFKNVPGVEFYIEDMEEQVNGVQKKPLGLIVGQSATLPKEFLKRFNIEEVQFRVNFPGQQFSSTEELYQKMEEALKKKTPLPTTSQPSFGEFLSCYKNALEKFEQILVITPSAKLSGTYSSARIARQLLEENNQSRVFIFDSANISLGEGLVAIYAQELIEQGEKIEEITERLKELRLKAKFFILFNKF
ncbi:glycerol-3-phosphate acyltransferase, partial [Patescibacteria group bacterium]|nr:glycerol-3-phosphate acyltransferase [Patescibacteria group bacterium]